MNSTKTKFGAQQVPSPMGTEDYIHGDKMAGV